jgi:hypothetical protein
MVLVNMIADTKTQNIIVVATLILGIVSGLGLATSSSYFAGSYSLVTNLEFNLLEVRIAGLDPTNESIDPRITLVFNAKVPTGSAGDASISYFRVEVDLNERPFLYTQAWRKYIPVADQPLYPGYDTNFTVGETIYELLDKQILYDAENSDDWSFSLLLVLSYDVFGASASPMRIAFTHEGHT